MDNAIRMPGGGSSEWLTALRIIDANFNRATEGLRVVEDHCRFALNDAHLSERAKRLRHDLATALGAINGRELAAARQTETDVGTVISTPQEQSRQSLAEIAAASWQRVQQALRVIEEHLKLLAPAAAAQVEALRYQSYTLAKACSSTADSQVRLARAKLYVLIDGASSECAFVERVQDLIAAGVHVLQLRDKQLDDRMLLERARLLRRILDDQARERGTENRGLGPVRSKPSTQYSVLSTRDGSNLVKQLSTDFLTDSRPPTPDPRLPLFILNDRPDIALLSRADGVHVGQEELTVHEARQIVGPSMLIGVSTHNIEQARQAVLDGANYIGCGPTFPSGTKHFDRFPGLEFLRQVAAEISLPSFAIGGITRENLPQVLATGFTRVAVGGAIRDQSSPDLTASELLAMLGKSR
jgi:thiamine-phosphate pyrophosphorylase